MAKVEISEELAQMLQVMKNDPKRVPWAEVTRALRALAEEIEPQLKPLPRRWRRSRGLK